MFDHYTQRELTFKLNCHKETLHNLAKIGPGFGFIRVSRGMQQGYVIRKDEFYKWMNAVSRDNELRKQVEICAPHLTFISVATDMHKWRQDRDALNRVEKTYQRRPYGRGLKENENKTECSGAGSAV